MLLRVTRLPITSLTCLLKCMFNGTEVPVVLCVFAVLASEAALRRFKPLPCHTLRSQLQLVIRSCDPISQGPVVIFFHLTWSLSYFISPVLKLLLLA